MEASASNLWTLAPEPEDLTWGLYVTAVGAGVTHLAVPTEDWRMLYLVRGAAILVVGGRRQRLEAGHVVLLPPQRTFTLHSDPQRPTRAHRLDFNGDLMTRWATAGFFGAFPAVLRPGFDETLLGHIRSMVELARLKPLGMGRLLAGVLANLLARLETVARSGAGAGAGRQRHLVQEARHLLADPARDRLRLDSIAEDLGVSYSWFRQAFRRQAGFPPQRFRQNQRMTRACQLLADTQLPITAIAQELGFGSLAYFSRVFRKETGLSPSTWRKTRP